MGNAAVNFSLGKAAFGKFLLMFGVVIALSACGSRGDDSRISLAPPPPSFTPSENDDTGNKNRPAMPMDMTRAIIIPDNAPAILAFEASKSGGPERCKLKDRFDRSSALSFRSDDGRKILSLNMKTDGASVEQGLIRFTYRFQSGPQKKEHCLYPSRVQGLIGSVYNEFIERDTDTITQQLRGAIADLTD